MSSDQRRSRARRLLNNLWMHQLQAVRDEWSSLRRLECGPLRLFYRGTRSGVPVRSPNFLNIEHLTRLQFPKSLGLFLRLDTRPQAIPKDTEKSVRVTISMEEKTKGFIVPSQRPADKFGEPGAHWKDSDTFRYVGRHPLAAPPPPFPELPGEKRSRTRPESDSLCSKPRSTNSIYHPSKCHSGWSRAL